VRTKLAAGSSGHGTAVILDRLGSIEVGRSRPVIYDRDIGMRLLYEDPDSGAEHYLIRYPPGLKAQMHRHTAAQTIILLKGQLVVNDRTLGPGSYVHFPAREPMFHAPAGGEGCMFVTIFHGPADVEPLGQQG
jgi:quercetin dioxygenase-like cupin family protein